MDDGELHRGSGYHQRGFTNSACVGFQLAVTIGARMRGLLFRRPDDITLVLAPCRAVHTFGMTHPIDIAFIARDGCVLKVFRSVKGWRHIRVQSAVAVIERFARDGDGYRWLKRGDYIQLACITGPAYVSPNKRYR